MIDKSTIENLIENTPFALIIIGVFLVLTGAAGGWPSLSLEVRSPGWQIAIAILGILIGSMGGLLLWQERTTLHKRKSAFANKYGITITSHDNEAKVMEVPYSFTLQGEYTKPIPQGSLIVFSRYSEKYWPASKPSEYKAENGRWRTEVYLGGQLGTHLLVVAVIGQISQEACKNYWKVGQEKDVWLALKAPDSDILECDKVVVNRVE